MGGGDDTAGLSGWRGWAVGYLDVHQREKELELLVPRQDERSCAGVRACMRARACGLAWLGLLLITRRVPSTGQRAHAGYNLSDGARAHTRAHLGWRDST